MLLKRVLRWLGFLAFTAAFFAIPVMIHEQSAGPDVTWNSPTELGTRASAGVICFDFGKEDSSRVFFGDSAAVVVNVRSDSAENWVSIFVNGKREEMASAVHPDSGRIVFKGIPVLRGRNEIAAVLHKTNGDTLAVRRATIFSIHKM